MAKAKKRTGFVKRVGRAVKRRYFKGKGYRNPKVGQMAKDVMMLKRLINAEKKRYQINSVSSPQVVGQVNGNSTGHYALDLTPLPGQGTSYNQRTGNSIKWASSYFSLQFTHQSATVQKIKLRLMLVKVVGTPYSNVQTAIQGQFLQANLFTTGSVVYDYYSQRIPDYFRNFKVLRSKTITLNQDTLSSQPVIKTVTFGHKFDHHVRWATDGTTVSEGQVILLVLADSGNCSTTTACTIANGIPVTAVNTGLVYNYNIVHYFIDN